MKTYHVDIKEIWDAVVTVSVSDDATREEIIEAAQEKFEREGAAHTDYNRTMDTCFWTIRS